VNVHQEIVDRFSPWLDAELAPAEEEALERHLDGCGPCRAEWERFADAAALLRGLPRERPSAAFTRRVVARTRLERRRRALRLREGALSLVAAEVAVPVLLVAAAAAVVVLLLLAG